MKIFHSVKKMVGAIATAALLLGASFAATPASAQQVVYGPGGVPSYVGIPGCPVAPYDMQNVLSGMYGVDGLNRPVNQYGFPVDVYGQCLTPAPVGEVFNAQPAPFYINFLWARYHYHWIYNPGFVHIYGGPGVIVHGGYGAIPYGHTNVIIQHNYHYNTVPVGPSVTVRPGYNAAPTTTVRPGGGYVPPATTVRPGGYAPPAAQAPSTYTPPRAAGAPSAFNRPTVAPSAPARQAPSTFTPSRSSGSSSSFVRRPH